MGNLTDDIARLCGEIQTLRDSRRVFGSQRDKETMEMKIGVSKLRTGFRKDQKIWRFGPSLIGSISCQVWIRKLAVS